MPYEIAFTKSFPVTNQDQYINDCCWGGDVVRDRLLPGITAKYENIRTEQEDWGWFIWFKKGALSLAVDIFCDDPKKGEFRVLLTARRKRWLVTNEIVDGPELEDLRAFICNDLDTWLGNPCKISRVDP